MLISRLAKKANWASSLQFRDFRFVWASTVFYSLSTGMEQVAVGWLVFDLTGSPFMVGVSAAARMAPFFFLGIFSGAIADWLDRRTLLWFSTLVGILVSSVMAAMLLLGATHIWVIIGLVAASGCVFAFVLTTRQAYTVDIVGQQHSLNGLSLGAIAMQVGGVVGSILSGTLIHAVGPGWQYVAIGIAYGVSATVLLGTSKAGQTNSPHREPVLANLVGYFHLMGSNRILLTLMMLASITEVFGFTHMTLLPVFAKEVLGVGSIGLGFMTAVRQGGALIGLLFLANLRNFQSKGLLMFGIAFGFGAGMMLFYLAYNLLVFLLVLAVVNAFAMAVDTLYKTLMQENVADEQRGRAMGSWVFSIGVAPVGHLGVGGLASVLGAPSALLVNGTVLSIVSLATMVGLPRIRRLP
ncbi:MAG: hypothetical protein CL753_00965 [Chloroflexi bacterium]|nr:hypothetical protein [Chloroflexota bacterium]